MSAIRNVRGVGHAGAVTVATLCLTLAACSGDGSGANDDDDDAGPPPPVESGDADEGGAPPDPGSGTARYEGTWRTACEPSAGGLLASFGDSTHATFTYDGTRAAFATEYFEDTACTPPTSASTELVGTLAFGDTVVEDVFGIDATIITFSSEISRLNGMALTEGSVPAPFRDLIYRSTDAVVLGDGSRTDPDTGTPTALRVTQPYRYVGPADPERLD